ncbi:type 1 glutamine amidotransferase [Verminephrobacter aporrectodeae]|uniref:type 1 glutamine amidotransferase n=1 Tax=Verminephrobacter aporrectodeae TaxID=1110389 RepID=UPI00224305FF|nr:type 1 glutamine amidotransferase [Verminephrobacter aporrectodeae]MCW8176950.1 type 1 glutamine amidotransferase [Verminephrobacter aporrectodeae subsp. tuberculatae]MCW8204428.1 type 1 glutamine amidotransferase [Verminephrobacter aporrectodeae subsp. tuberculatae]
MRILVFQHLAAEGPSVLLDFWLDRGHECTVVELDEGDEIPSFENYDLLAVMGGPMHVWQEGVHPWLVREKSAIRKWVVDDRKPYLGMCLGHQLLAVALGGQVSPMPRPEVGLAEIELTAEGACDAMFEGFSSLRRVFQWHSAEVSRVPAGSVVLAENDACAVQAMRWGVCAYGFQFHAEISETTVTDWESIPQYMESLCEALGAERAHLLAAEVRPLLPNFRSDAYLLSENLREIVLRNRPHSDDDRPA